jgi:hypothetical protein
VVAATKDQEAQVQLQEAVRAEVQEREGRVPEPVLVLVLAAEVAQAAGAIRDVAGFRDPYALPARLPPRAS